MPANAAERLFVLSNRISRVGVYLPFAVVITFTLYGCCSHMFLVEDSSFAIIAPSSFWRNQQIFLSREGVTGDLSGYFFIFKVFIWIASIAGVACVLTGLSSVQVLDSYRDKFEIWRRTGRSGIGFAIAILLVGPFAMLCSFDFELVSSSVLVRAMIKYSPGTFLCFESFFFCGGVFFSAEGILFLTWVVFLRWRADTNGSA
jgi:hypothetical protein